MLGHDSVNNSNRYLSPLDVWAMAFGCMVGWGSFVMPSSTFLPLAGPAGTIIAMAIGLAIMLVIGYCVSFLMMRTTRTGGIYSYTKEAFGRDHAFLCSWFLCLSYLTIVFLNGTALFLVFRTLMGDRAHVGFHYTIVGNPVYLNEVLMSVAALVGVGLLFLMSRNSVRRLSTVLAVLLLVGMATTAIVCLPKVFSREIFGSFGYENVNQGFAIFSLVILAPWAFVGFEVITLDTAHFKFPVKKTARVVTSSIVVAALAYTSMAIVSASVVPDGYSSWQSYFQDLGNLRGIISLPTFYAAKSAMGTFGITVISIAALAAILTGIIGAYRAILHMLNIMAEDKILASIFTKTKYCILFIMTLSILISLVGRNTLNWFVDLTSFGAIVAYGYTCAAAYKLARLEANRKIMTAGILGTIISIVFGIVQLVPRLVVLDTMSGESFLLLSLWCLLGFVFYWHTVKQSTLTDYSGLSASGVILFALLVYTALMWMGKLLWAQSTLESLHSALRVGGIVLLLIILVGFIVMIYIQNLVRKLHESKEREKIRVVEGSLAKSQFLFNISHDLRTPMNAIIGYTTLAQKEPPEMQRSYLSKIEKSSRKLLRLINDILEMSRIDTGQLQPEFNPTDLCLLLEEQGALFAPQMRQKRIDFAVHTSQVRNRHVWCDKTSLNRVLLNLVANAYKYTPQGGTISAAIYEGDSGENGYGSYEIRVKDSGIGMTKEAVAKIFNAFDRERTASASDGDGTGLELAITKKLVNLMGGSIEVFTSPGNGTEFVIHLKFRLAAAKDMKKEKVAGLKPGEAFDFADKRLLLVEDNAGNLELAQLLLKQAGFQVDTAENGKIAVEKVTASRPGDYDAILMDLQMPIMDGYAATREIRSLPEPWQCDIPILGMTSNALSEDLKAVEEAGMQARIAKPIDISILKKELKEIWGTTSK
ncbi:MAG: amino acid permease [Victivallales bacterium]|nr:amino acid permease [Victivallales bacterium]